MRNFKNNELRLSDEGKNVKLVGWVSKVRNLGGLLFIDLRDRYGITQLTCKPSNPLHKEAEKLRNEYVIAISGIVKERESKNPNLLTGEIEVEINNLNVLSEAETTPLIIADKTDALEEVRMKYRYLDLRRPVMQHNLIIRHKIAQATRRYLNSLDFIEVETPVFGKSTPEGAREYVVPARLHPGNFYVLPQSPQIYKQLLMIAGLERYYQIVKCFRDEDARADRQMEFTQIDLEMSFIDEDDIYSLVEGMMKTIYKDTLNLDITTPFPRLNYEDALNLYGTDKPDTRFDLLLNNISTLVKDFNIKIFSDVLENNGLVKALRVPKASLYSRKQIDKWTEEIKRFKASGLIWLKYDGSELSGSIVKALSEEDKLKLINELKLESEDLVLISAGSKTIVNQSLAYLRNYIGKDLKLIDETKHNLLWLTDWPSFEYDEETKTYQAAHHPFTSPKEDSKALILTNPEKAYSKCYDLVLNGYELGSGSIRIHDQKLQADMFKAIGLSEAETKEKFGFFIEALKYGTPPHGGIALGLDRLAMILTNTNAIRDVIAFPKTANALDLMSEAPSKLDEKILKELKIKIEK